MLDLAALDVAVGLIFLFFILSLICSSVNEFVSYLFRWRAKTLREGIVNLLSGESEVTPEGRALARQVYEHPLVQGLVRPSAKRSWPSYIPARTFVSALLSLREGEEDETGEPQARSVEEAIAAVPNARVRKALDGLYQRAQGDAQRFQAGAEEWFDDAMERVSGWYRRRVQIALTVIAAGLALALNADTVQIARHLWSDKAVRTAVIERASAVSETGVEQPDIREVATTVDELDELNIPLGWSTADDPTPETPDPQRLLWPWDDWGWFFGKLLGLALTTAALTLGAPFWFDVLSKVARVRASGAPPPTTDAVRKGEGEEKRAGPTASAAPEEPHD
jgi:hypothetical protein